MDNIEKNLRDLQNEYSDPNNTVYDVAKNGFVWSNLAKSVQDQNELDVLFVGINPSLIGEESEEYYSFNPQDYKSYPRYFKPFHDVISMVETKVDKKLNWTMMDLLYLRKTTQAAVLKLLEKADGPDYFAKQLCISMDRLEVLNPKLIVVCNTGAASFMGIDAHEDFGGVQGDVWMGYKFSFDDDLGVYRIETNMNDSDERINNNFGEKCLIGSYVIFTSSLTFMSRYTKSTLMWQMKKVLEK